MTCKHSSSNLLSKNSCSPLEFIAWHLDSIGLFDRSLPLSLLQAGQVFPSSTGIEHTKDVLISSTLLLHRAKVTL